MVKISNFNISGAKPDCALHWKFWNYQHAPPYDLETRAFQYGFRDGVQDLYRWLDRTTPDGQLQSQKVPLHSEDLWGPPGVWIAQPSGIDLDHFQIRVKNAFDLYFKMIYFRPFVPLRGSRASRCRPIGLLGQRCVAHGDAYDTGTWSKFCLSKTDSRSDHLCRIELRTMWDQLHQSYIFHQSHCGWCSWSLGHIQRPSSRTSSNAEPTPWFGSTQWRELARNANHSNRYASSWILFVLKPVKSKAQQRCWDFNLNHLF